MLSKLRDSWAWLTAAAVGLGLFLLALLRRREPPTPEPRRTYTDGRIDQIEDQGESLDAEFQDLAEDLETQPEIEPVPTDADELRDAWAKELSE